MYWQVVVLLPNVVPLVQVCFVAFVVAAAVQQLKVSSAPVPLDLLRQQLQPLDFFAAVEQLPLKGKDLLSTTLPQPPVVPIQKELLFVDPTNASDLKLTDLEKL